MTRLIKNKFDYLNKKIQPNKMLQREKIKKGFSLIESLLSLSLSLIIVLFGLESLLTARHHFLKLQDEEQAREAAYAALDKIRFDLLKAGLGLFLPLKQGLLQALTIENNTLSIVFADEELKVISNYTAGQTKILVNSHSKIKKGCKICIFDLTQAEIKSVSAVGLHSFTISSPLAFSYAQPETSLVLLKEISIYLNSKKHILRRKVNSSPAQPLLEEVSSFQGDYDKETNLVKLKLNLLSKEEKTYESLVFLKNLALAFNK